LQAIVTLTTAGPTLGGHVTGVELVEDRGTKQPADALGTTVTDECLERGLSMNIVRAGTNANCLRLAPPLTIRREEIDLAVEIMDASLRTAVGHASRPQPTAN
jgi:2,2-dialkylglycine decarboxylase (pyruvate)